jgi:hypothetical protein
MHLLQQRFERAQVGGAQRLRVDARQRAPGDETRGDGERIDTKGLRRNAVDAFQPVQRAQLAAELRKWSRPGPGEYGAPARERRTPCIFP